MAGKYGDSRELRLIDRIKALAWREAMEDGASFMNIFQYWGICAL